jgi:hypothetical protein
MRAELPTVEHLAANSPTPGVGVRPVWVYVIHSCFPTQIGASFTWPKAIEIVRARLRRSSRRMVIRFCIPATP